jgi:hypothetical protein
MNAVNTLTVVLVALATACSTAAVGKGETSITSAPTGPPCPLGVEGAEVSVEDTPQGVALTFTTSRAEKADELRARGRHAANMYGPRKAGAGHDGRHASGGHHGLMPMQMPPAYALAEDVESGIKVRLFPVDDKDLGTLRAKARERAVAMMTSCR